eukprot:1156896-Pelagomonas_calceolata.AAC.6
MQRFKGFCHKVQWHLHFASMSSSILPCAKECTRFFSTAELARWSAQDSDCINNTYPDLCDQPVIVIATGLLAAPCEVTPAQALSIGTPEWMKERARVHERNSEPCVHGCWPWGMDDEGMGKGGEG